MARRIMAAMLTALLLVGPAAIGPVAARQAAPTAEAAGDSVYADPAGRFTVPIPTGWRAETRDGYGVLTDPEGQLLVYVLTSEGTDPAAAIDAAWQTVDPAFALTPIDGVEFPPPPGFERAAVALYDTGEASGRARQGVGLLAEGLVYVLLADGDVLAAERRQSQLTEILTGLAVTGQARTDLSGVRPAALTPELLAELDAYVGDVMARTRVPGAAVAIVQDGQVVHSRGFGVRALGGGALVTPETLMMIGSTTKSMTTMMAASLVDDGHLGWDTPVVDVLPGFAVADAALTPRITVRNLFCACTGVPRRDFEFLFNADELSAGDVVTSLRDFEFFTGFGEAFQYSNQMVAVGGYAAAAASGEPGDLYDAYERAMRERVLDPIGMTDSTFSFEAVRADDDYAWPHAATLSATYAPLRLDVEEILSPVAPAGALWSSASEMARYVVTELNRGVAPDGQRVVSAENLGVTWEPQVPVSATASYGLGWFVDEYKGAPLIHHGGNTAGFTSDLAFLPEAGLGIVVLTNAQGANAFVQAVRYRLFELVYAQPFEFDEGVSFALEQTAQALAELRLGDAIAADVIDRFAGKYANAALGEIALLAEGGGLVLDAGEFRSALRPVLDEAGAVSGYVMVDPGAAGLPVDLREENGAPVVVLGGGVAEYVFGRAFPDPPFLPAATQ